MKEIDLGSSIHSQRTKLGLTLEELAERSGVSRAMLSDVERNVKNPTIRVVCQIAKGLSCTVSQLLGEETEGSKGIVVTRKNEQQVLIDPRSSVERHLLSPALLYRGLEILRYVIPPGQSTGSFPAHQAGVIEHITVVQGRLQCNLGVQEVLLEPGDSVSFNADVAHNFCNSGTESCCYFLVIDSEHKNSHGM